MSTINDDNPCKPKIRMDLEHNCKLQVRKRKLFEELSSVKLEYKENGICDAYIKFGKPSLEEVISNIQKRSDDELMRYQLLIYKLNKNNLIYDERVSYYKNYITMGGSLKKAIEEGQIEWFYLNMTNYSELLKIYKDEEKAQSIALTMYLKKNKPNRFTKKIYENEMCLSLCL